MRGDRHEIQQVLLNLLTNAVHALSELPPEAERRILVTTGREDDRSFVRVTDTGPGIPSALIGRIFTPFFTTKQSGQGTGLGLSISYGIVESHGGRLSYAPAEGGGSTFTVQIPAYGSGPVPRLAPFRILVADADRSVHRVVTALLPEAGVQIHTARTGAEAVAMTKEREYDLLLLDPTLAGSSEPLIPLLLGHRPDLVGRLVLLGEAGAPGEPDLPDVPRLAKPLVPRDARTVMQQVLGRRDA